jgi:hypothetical protein
MYFGKSVTRSQAGGPAGRYLFLLALVAIQQSCSVPQSDFYLSEIGLEHHYQLLDRFN